MKKRGRKTAKSGRAEQTKSEVLEKQNLFILAILLIIFLITFIVYSLCFTGKCHDPSRYKNRNLELPENSVVEVIDGDTFTAIVNKTEEKIRLICIDSPELGEENSEEAREFLESLILNKQVRLLSDVEERDSYNRLLRYAYVASPEGEIFVNKEMVKQGYASASPVHPNTKLCEEMYI